MNVKKKTLYVHSLKEKLSFATCLMQLQVFYATKKFACNNFFVACDMFNCIRQVAKNNFSTSDFIILWFQIKTNPLEEKHLFFTSFYNKILVASDICD
jgi:hypothetical protein